jgi:hypothetical protein
VSKRRLVLATVAATASAVTLTAFATAARPFQTAMYANEGVADLARIGPSGATAVRITLAWPSVAPATQPAEWDPSNPADPNYNWTVIDPIVQDAARRGLMTYITVAGAPAWAQTAPAEPDALRARLPDAAAFGQFARAVAARYSGRFQKLPRVRYFQAWNEPNISLSLVPQLVDRKPVAVYDYRDMLNAFARAVHSVHRDNVVIAAGLAPFRDITPEIQAQDEDWGPLSFMRELLCISASGAPTCRTRVDFDIWATHPYTSGGPTHRAVLPNDVSLGDLAKMRAVLDAASKAGHLTKRHPAFWVTEFSWDSKPPDPQGVPNTLLTRWVAEALYRLWNDGVSLVTWLQVRDQPMSASFWQSGLWYAGGRPKPALRAFRFPLVALPQANGRVLVWGRTPRGERRPVIVEQSRGGAWKRVARLIPDRYGVFQTRLATPATGRMRARVTAPADISPPFGLAAVPDQTFNPFGQPTPLEPEKKTRR